MQDLYEQFYELYEQLDACLCHSGNKISQYHQILDVVMVDTKNKCS